MPRLVRSFVVVLFVLLALLEWSCASRHVANNTGRVLLALRREQRRASRESLDDEASDVRPADRVLARLHGVQLRHERGAYKRTKQRKVVSKSEWQERARLKQASYWHGPPLLSTWRNVGGKRMRDDWKYATQDRQGTIFVSVVSYRDDKCPLTLMELFSKAARPELVNVGLVQQNEPGDVDCFAEYCRQAGTRCRRDNVRMIRMAASEARGVMVVRHLATTLFEGEQYFMQVDSHCLFARNWDVRIIEDLNKITDTERVLLSHHPPASDSFNRFDGQGINICKYQWDGNGLPRFSAQVVTLVEDKPFPGVFVGAGMVFARSEILIDCPWDKNLPYLFSGEELLLAACAWSHGWNIYNPSATPLFHFYKDSAKMKVFNPTNDDLLNKSVKRLKFALGVEGTLETLPEGVFRKEFDVYGMGDARRLDEFYQYAGVDWKMRDEHFPFCSYPRSEKDNALHYQRIIGLPRLDTLSYDSGVSVRDPQYEVLTGAAL